MDWEILEDLGSLEKKETLIRYIVIKSTFWSGHFLQVQLISGLAGDLQPPPEGLQL